MVCRLPHLIMLLAQVLSTVAPVCFIQCVGPDGHECIQPIHVKCVCCEEHAQPKVADCGKAECDCCPQHDHDCEPVVVAKRDAAEDEPADIAMSPRDCGCQHRPLESSPAATQVRSTQLCPVDSMQDIAIVAWIVPAQTGALGMHWADRSDVSQIDVLGSAPLRALAATVLRC